MRIELENHGPDEATIDVLPTLWFRNTWSWDDGATRPRIEGDGTALVVADHRLAGYRLEAAPGPDGTAPEALFCENESNAPRVFGSDATTPYPKDGINDHVVSGAATVNPEGFGTKAALRYRVTVPGGGKAELRLQAAPARRDGSRPRAGPASAFDEVVAAREADADEFYARARAGGHRRRAHADPAAGVRRARLEQADVPVQRAPLARRRPRRAAAARGAPARPQQRLAPPRRVRRARDAGPVGVPVVRGVGPRLPLRPVGAPRSRRSRSTSCVVLLREWFQHPNGALPAYEWNFDDVNPPVHVMAALRVFMIDGATDREFLERIFQKLLINFTWWLNREDADGNNVFSGGFLGLDNISPIDRSNLPEGVTLEQADGTAWMAYYALSMLVIAIVLAEENDVYLDMVIKFLEQFVLIARALERQGLYDAEDGVLLRPARVPVGRDGAGEGADDLGPAPAAPGRRPARRAAVEPPSRLGKRFARLRDELRGDGRRRMVGRVRDGSATSGSVLVSVIDPEQLRHTLQAFFDEAAFLSPHGLRAVSKRYENNPYTLDGRRRARGSTTSRPSRRRRMFGGNSNWRGPDLDAGQLPGDPRSSSSTSASSATTSSSSTRPARASSTRFGEIAQDLADRIVAIWLPGRRTAAGRSTADTEKLQTDPAWKDNLTFNEYFHGDNGAGLGATHQTGWTALVVDLILDPPGSSEIPPRRRAGQLSTNG